MLTKTKAAVIRRPGYPIGQPAPCFIRCCDQEIDVPEYGSDRYTHTVACPACGKEYHQDGRIVEERWHYVQIVRDGDQFDADGWTPWKLGDSRPSAQETALLALHKWLREGGYARPDADYEPFSVMVYVADQSTPRHPNGRLMACGGFKMKVSPRAAQ